MKISKKLQNIAPYDPTVLVDGVKLDANESYRNLDEELGARIAQAVAETAFNRYPDPFATELCAAAADYYGVKPEQVVAGNGSDELISILFTTFFEKGSRITVAEPDFSMYRFYAELSELNVISYPKQDLIIDPDALMQAAQGVDALIFSNPCNPTGLGLSRTEVLGIVRSLPCLVIVDEAYMEFWDQSVIDEVENFDNLLVLRTCSKALGLAGIRLGFAVGNKTLIDNYKKAKSPFNVNTLTQAAGLAVLRETEYIKSCIHAINASKNALQTALSQYLPICESVTNFVLVHPEDCDGLFAALQDAGICVRKIMGDYLRITAGSPGENEAVVRVVAQFMTKGCADHGESGE